VPGREKEDRGCSQHTAEDEKTGEVLLELQVGLEEGDSKCSGGGRKGQGHDRRQDGNSASPRLWKNVLPQPRTMRKKTGASRSSRQSWVMSSLRGPRRATRGEEELLFEPRTLAAAEKTLVGFARKRNTKGKST